jgi:hypothetical protein
MTAGLNPVWLIMYNILTLLCGGYIVWFFLKKCSSRKNSIILFLILIFCGQKLFTGDEFTTFLYCIFFSFLYSKEKKVKYLVIVAFFTLISFYAKISTGFVVSVLFFFFIIWLMINKILQIRSVILLLILYSSAVFVTSLLLKFVGHWCFTHRIIKGNCSSGFIINKYLYDYSDVKHLFNNQQEKIASVDSIQILHNNRTFKHPMEYKLIEYVFDK